VSTSFTQQQRREELIAQMRKCIDKAGWAEHEPDCKNCRALLDKWDAARDAPEDPCSTP